MNARTPHQINLIKSSFAKIYFSRDESARLFYDRLFEIAPQVRPLFKSDMDAQRRKLMDTLALVVTATSHPETIEHLLQDTARHHVGYGATADHYELVGKALLWMIERQLGSDFTPGVKAVWTDLYQEIATTMQRIGREGRPAG
jgi:hemoglobin-like flavoprotein